MKPALSYMGFKYNETFKWWERPINNYVVSRRKDEPLMPIFHEDIKQWQKPQSIVITKDRFIRFKFQKRKEVSNTCVMRRHVPDLSDLDYITWEDQGGDFEK